MERFFQNKLIPRSLQTNTGQATIYACLIGTIILFWSDIRFSSASPVSKLLFVCAIYVSIVVFPFYVIRHGDFDKKGKAFIQVLLALGVFQIIRSLFNTDEVLYAFGNKYITLLLNDCCSPLFFPPLFCFLAVNKNNVHILQRCVIALMVIGFVFLFLRKSIIFGWMVTYLAIFFPYVKKNYKILIIITYLFTSYLGLTTEYGRVYIISSGFALAAYYLAYVLKSKRIIVAFCITVTILPFFLFIPAFYTSKSAFVEAKDYIMQESGDESLAMDTRTFLYQEMAEDLSATGSWFLGKGAMSYYYSYYFDEDSNGRYGRLTSEVTFLNFLLRSGCLYFFFYSTLFFRAIYCALKWGRNRFVLSVAIMLSGNYFNLFIGEGLGCNFYHMAIFMLMGCCLSRKWLMMSDKAIRGTLGNPK